MASHAVRGSHDPPPIVYTSTLLPGAIPVSCDTVTVTLRLEAGVTAFGLPQNPRKTRRDPGSPDVPLTVENAEICGLGPGGGGGGGAAPTYPDVNVGSCMFDLTPDCCLR